MGAGTGVWNDWNDLEIIFRTHDRDRLNFAYIYIYCAARNNPRAFVFATFCTIMRTPHLVGGPTGF